MNDLLLSTMQGKMEGIKSINTNNLEIAYCKKMSKNLKTICFYCYANKNLKTFRKNCIKRYSQNLRLLTDPRFQPVKYKEKIIRIHAYGELSNLTHLKNIIKIVNYNKSTLFSLWTKRLDLIKKLKNKPSNLIIIYSSVFLNKVVKKIPHKHIDKVFNVVEDKSDSRINCKQKCIKCMLCYSKNNTKIIYERLK